MRARRLFPIALLLLASCSNETMPPVSQGLKIFVTSRAHVADFANDPELAGANAIAKADTFCETDPARPSAATYKALLVDGVNRDARTLVDWVLKPSTAYYRARGDVPIGTTTAAAIFGVAYQPLLNTIAAPQWDPVTRNEVTSEVWTGIGNAADFSSGADCNHWSDLTNTYTAQWGRPQATSAIAFAAAAAGCYYFQFPIYCVEQ